MGTTTWKGLLSGPWTSAPYIAACGPINTSPTTLALNSAYTYGSAGAAYGIWFVAPETANLTDFSVFVSAVAGTGATGGNLNWSLRTGVSGSYVPTSTLVDSGTFSVSNTTGWKNVTGLTSALTAGKIYCLIIADANGNGTNYVTVNTGSGGSSYTYRWSTASTTTNGFGAGSATSKPPFAAWQIGGVWYGGNCVDTTNTVTSGTYERGCRFRIPVSMTFAGVTEPLQDLGVSTSGTLYLYADGTAPGSTGSALASFAFPSQTYSSSSPAPMNVLFPTSQWYDLTPNTWYRCLYKPSSSATTPRKAYVNNSGSPLTIPSGVRSGTYPLGGDCYWTDGSTGSFVDDTNSISLMGPILVPGPSAASGIQIGYPAGN